MIESRGERPEEPALGRHLAKQRQVHEAFAASRRGIYVEQTAAMEELDRFGRDGGAPGLLVTGESGAGKSALLANWAMRVRGSSPGAFVVEHYVGSSFSNRSHLELLRRIATEIAVRYSLSEAPPADPDALEEDLPGWLARVQAETLHLVIDGLDQLERPEEIVRWLPEYIQPHVRIVAAAQEGVIPELLSSRGWRIWRVDPLTGHERAEIVARYLQHNQVHVDASYLQQVFDAGPTANPLFLRTSLEELRRSEGTPIESDAIDEYLSAPDVSSLMDHVLARIERTHGRALVASMLAHLWASRDGLTADEAAALAGAGSADAETLFDSLSLHLIEHDRRRSFFHEQFRDAIRRRYVGVPGAEAAVRRSIADYFAAVPVSERSLAELPWQLLRLEAWDELLSVVTSPEVVATLQRSREYPQLLLYWSELRPHVDLVAELFARTTAAVEHLHGRDGAADLCDLVGTLLSDIGELEPAARLLEQGLAIRREGFAPSHPDVLASTVNLARLLNRRGEHAEGERRLREAITTMESSGGTGSRIHLDALEALGTVLAERREFDAALPVCQRALEIAEAAGDEAVEVSRFLSLMGAVLFGRTEYASAGEYLARAHALASQRLGRSHPITIECLNNLGTSLALTGQFERGETCLRDAIAAWERLFGPRSVPVASGLANLASFFLKTGRAAEAVETRLRAVEIYRALLGETHPATAVALDNLASAYRVAGAFAEAEAVQRRAIASFESAYGEHHGETVQAQLNLALILALGGDAARSIEIYRVNLPLKAELLGLGHPRVQNSITKYREILAAAGLPEHGDPLRRYWDGSRA